MLRVAFSALQIPLLLAIVIPSPSLAAPAITCHCFTDRSYDPARPAIADPYFLALTQNTLFSEIFTVDKKSIVIKKQAGVSADDLWVAYWLASRSGRSPDSLLQERETRGSWNQVAGNGKFPAKSLGAAFSKALNAQSPVSTLSQLVVNDLMAQYHLLPVKDISALRIAGATNQEVIIAAVMAGTTGRPATQLYRQVKTEGKSWGALLHEAKFVTADMQAEISRLLKTGR